MAVFLHEKGLIEFIIYNIAINFICLLFYDKNILVPIYLFFIGITAQIPEYYHHIFTYGMSVMVFWMWMLSMRGQYFSESIRFHRWILLYFLMAFIIWNFYCSLFSAHLIEGLFVTLQIVFFFIIVYIFYDWMFNIERILIIWVQ